MKKYLLVQQDESIQEAIDAYGGTKLLPKTVEDAEKGRDSVNDILYVIQPHKESDDENGNKTMCKS